MKSLFLLLMAFPVIAECQQQEIQRALIQRDQQSAEFASKGLETLHTRQLQEASQPLPPHLLPYRRERMKQEREQAKIGTDPFSPEKGSVPNFPDYRPLPLPGGPRHGVDPIPAPSVSG
jgi:hypothetical protein